MIWGLILGFHAACTTFAGLAIVRTLLGIFESWYVLSEDELIPYNGGLHKKQCCPDFDTDHCNVVQEGGARPTRILVLCLQLSHSNFWRLRRLRSQLCQYKVRELEDLLHCHWGVDHGHWAFGRHVFARFTR